MRLEATSRRSDGGGQISNLTADGGWGHPEDVLADVVAELRLTWLLIRHNVSFAFLPPFLFLAGSACTLGWGSDPRTFGVAALQMFFLFFGFNYVFDIANQVLGVEEDVLNKPSRPIPSGLMSVRGGIRRWILSWVLFPVIAGLVAGWWPGVFGAICWELTIALFYVWPKWVDTLAGRTLFTPLGAWIHIVVSSGIAARTSFEASSLVNTWALLVPCWFLFTIHLQDMHDVAGDAHMGRRTLPLLFAGSRSRQLRLATAAALLVFAGVFVLVGRAQSAGHPRTELINTVAALQFVFSAVVAFRTVALPGIERDDFTYRYLYAMVYGTLMFLGGLHVEHPGMF
jgi:4-hydroxybenzoate polyprenyltransferase